MLDNPFVLLALSIIPGLVYVSIYYNMDKHRKEPLGVILKAFFWGSAIVLPIGLFQSIFPETIFAGFFPFMLVYMVVLVGFTEELGKWLVVRFYAFRNPAFDEVTDGLVYGACTAGGFAVFENIFYVFDHGFETGILRSILSVPGHIFWGAISGYWIGRYKFTGVSRNQALWKGLGVATLSHGTFNACLSFDYTIIFAPMIVLYNGFLVRKYFRLAMEHDKSNLHNVNLRERTEINEHIEFSPDGQLAYKKERIQEIQIGSGMLKLMRLSFHLIAWIFILTGILALIGMVVEPSDQGLDEDIPVYIAIVVMFAIGIFLIFKAIQLKKKEELQKTTINEQKEIYILNENSIAERSESEISTKSSYYSQQSIIHGSSDPLGNKTMGPDRDKLFNKEKPPYQV